MKKGKIFLIILLCLLLIPLLINVFVISKSKPFIKDINNLDDVYDIGMVLGCGVKNNEPSLMLKDRLNTSIELYEKGIIKKILITGDHEEDYSEVLVMFNYLIENNISETDILIDYQGYNTGESMANFYKNYQDSSLIIITQKYHMYRSIYISDYYNLKAIGISTINKRYYGQLLRDIREVLARCKDFLKYFH